MSPLVLGQILGLLLDILGAYDKYPVQDCENLPLPIQIQLSEKENNFLEFFCYISFIYIKFWTFWKKRWS